MINKYFSLGVPAYLLTAAVLPAATLYDIPLLQWGEAGGDTGIVTSPGVTVAASGTYNPGTVSATSGGSYYPNDTDRDKDFNVTVSSGVAIAIEDNATGDTISINNANTNADKSAAVVWEATGHELAQDYTFTIESTQVGGFGEGNYWQFIMQDGDGNWYSQRTFDNMGWDVNTSIKASEITWYDYTPHASGDDNVSSSPSATGPVLAGAQAFGFRSFNFNGSDIDHDVVFFEVVQTIPEPSSVALLGLGAMTIALRRKRRIR